MAVELIVSVSVQFGCFVGFALLATDAQAIYVSTLSIVHDCSPQLRVGSVWCGTRYTRAKQ